MSRSAVSAERRPCRGVARWIFALALVSACTGSSAVWVDKARAFDILGSFPTDLFFFEAEVADGQDGVDEDGKK